LSAEQGTAPRWRHWLIEASIFLAALAAFQIWQVRDAARGPAPEVATRQLDGSPVHIPGRHDGQASLLYVWADWCAVCRTTAGNVTALAADLPVTSIASQSGDAAAIARMMRERSYAWPTVPDSRGDILKRYGLPGFLAFVVIAPGGDIRFVSLGYTSEPGLRLRLWWTSRT
jgi:thiol-disulfide isomerase/thioredoxin